MPFKVYLIYHGLGYFYNKDVAEVINQNSFSIFNENVFSYLIPQYITVLFHCISFRNKCWKKETFWLQGNLLDDTLKIAAIENYQLQRELWKASGLMTLIENKDKSEKDFSRFMILYIFETSVEKSSLIIFFPNAIIGINMGNAHWA